MSHFTVLVAANDEEELEQKLLPYYEYGCNSEHDEKVKPYLEFEVEVAKADIPAEVAKLKAENPEYQRMSPEHTLGAWHGGESNLNGDWGYWRNPNAKWDWYQVGGRWTGSLILKTDEHGVIDPAMQAIFDENIGTGEPGLMTEPCDLIDRADFAPTGMIDWRAMREHGAIAAYQKWSTYHDAKGRHGGDAKALHSELMHHGYFLDKNEVEELETQSCHEFMEKARQDALFFAFVDLEGKWHERGRMGWFAIVTDEQDGYPVDFWKFIEALPAEQRLYVVDCHI